MRLFIYCAGGLGREALDIALDFNEGNNKFKEIYFVDDAQQESQYLQKKINNIPLISRKDLLSQHTKEDELIIANGEPRIREKIYREIKASLKLASPIIAQNVFLSQFSKISKGVVIAPHSSIQSNSSIGLNVFINTMSIIAHDVNIGAHTVISSMVNLGGSVKIGKSSYIGMGAQIKEGIKIGSNSIIGMGSIVYNDIPNNVIALGNPARVAKKNINKTVFKS